MIKIIRKGKTPSEKVYKTTCHDCNTIFSFQNGDAEIHYDQRDGNYVDISCLVCDRRCVINTDILSTLEIINND